MVFIPKCRRKALYQELRRYLGEVFRKLALQKESKVEEGHLMPDHVHMLLAIPPKFAVSQVAGFIKGKSAIHLARVYGERKRNFVGQHFWARGFFVNTVGRDEEAIRGLHPQPGEGGPEARTNELLALTTPPFRRLQAHGPRQRPVFALSGSHPKAPGFAGGHLPLMKNDIPARARLREGVRRLPQRRPKAQDFRRELARVAAELGDHFVARRRRAVQSRPTHPLAKLASKSR